jgi:hypothetical protein
MRIDDLFYSPAETFEPRRRPEPNPCSVIPVAGRSDYFKYCLPAGHIRRLARREQPGGRTPAGLLLIVGIAKLLSVLVAEADVIHLIDGPGRPEAATAYLLSTFNLHDACGTIRFVGNYQLQTGRPSGSGANVRHGMRGQRDARLNLDLHARTEAPESQTHVVDRVGCVLWHATNQNAVA